MRVVAMLFIAGAILGESRQAAPPQVADVVTVETLADNVQRWTVTNAVDARPAFARRYEQRTGARLTQLPFGRSIAFLAGVSRYDHLRRLDGVRTDLERMRLYLVGAGGFDVVYVASDGVVTRDLVEDYMMNRFPRELTAEDRFIFYFAGHGADAPGGTTGYLQLQPATDEDFARHVIPVSRTAEWNSVLPARHALMVIDACVSGLGVVSQGNDADRALLRSLVQTTSRAILTAGTGREDTFQIPFDGDQIGVFTLALLTALERTQVRGPYASLLTMNQVFAQLDRHVTELGVLHNFQLTPRLTLTDPIRHRGSFVYLNPNAQGEIAPDLLAAMSATAPREAPQDHPEAPAGWEEMVLRFNGQTHRGQAYVLNFGTTANFAAPASAAQLGKLTVESQRLDYSIDSTWRGYDIIVQNLASQRRRWTLRVEGSGIEAFWRGGTRTVTAQPFGTEVLTIRADADRKDGKERVALMGETGEVWTMEFVYDRREATQVVTASSGPRASGRGTDFSPAFRVSLGKAPPGYTLVSDSQEFWLTGDRRCGAWSRCTWIRHDDQDVMFEFSLQGHGENVIFGIPQPGAIQESEGHLRATYRLANVGPSLSVRQR